MSESAAPSTPPPPPTVFLSYASEDRVAARTLRDALQALGLEVWYDESALDGGDAWDQKIRRQIRACDFFMPVISAQTAARPEGYFRREWRLAVERTLDMADDHLFLLPVVIDDISEARSRVPEKFLAVQWTRLPGGQSNEALAALCRRLTRAEGSGPAPAAEPAPESPATPDRRAGRRVRAAAAAARELPEVPREEPGQRVRFWLQLIGWMLQSVWILFQRLPGWVRILIYLWLAVVVASSRSCVSPDEEHHSADVTPADAAKLKSIAQSWQGNSDKSDTARLGTQIAQAFSDELGANLGGARQPILAVPFAAPPGDAAAQKLADSTFAEVYGRIALSRHGHVGLAEHSLADSAAALASAREHHASYVLYGTVDRRASAPSLTVSLLKVADAAVIWSASYPVAGADPAAIAAEVAARAPDAQDD
jgi:TolB-like protein